MYLLPANIQLGCPFHWFFTQAGWTYDQTICFLEMFLGVIDE